ncbi:MAG: GAF domain-containing protein, partial [Anaerolineales bacterium]
MTKPKQAELTDLLSTVSQDETIPPHRSQAGEPWQEGQVLTAAVKISEVVHFAQDLNQLYKMIHDIISELMPAENFYIALYDPEEDLVTFPYFIDQFDDAFPPQRPGQGLTEFVIKTGEPLLASPEVFDELVKSGEVETIGAPSIDWLGVPLITRDRTIGMLAVQTYTPGIRYGETEKDMLVFVSTQVAMAIERKKGEEALRLSEERYRSLVDNLPVGVYRCTPGPDGRIEMANPSFFAMFGFDQASDLLSITVHDLYLEPGEGTEIDEILVQNGSLAGREIRLKRPDQKPLWGALTAQLEKKEGNGHQIYHDCALVDITERKQREQEREAIISMSAALRLARLRSEMPQIIIDNVALLLRTNGAALVLIDQGNGDLFIEVAQGKWNYLSGTRLVQRGNLSQEIVTNGKVYQNNSVKDDVVDPRLRPFEKLPCVACVPMIAHELTLGLLWVGMEREILPDEIRTLVALADISANAIHRATLHEQTERRVQRLAALRAVDTAIGASLDLRLALNVLLSQLTNQLNVDASCVLLYDPDNRLLEHASARGFHSTAISNSCIKIGEGPAGKAALSRERIHITNLQENESAHLKERMLSNEGFIAYHAVPLIAKGQLKGVLEIFHRSILKQDPEWVDFLETMAGQAAIAIDNASLFTALQRSNMELALAYDTTLEGWVHALEMREQVTDGHSQVLVEWTVRMARLSQKSESEIAAIRRGVLLHDIGKLALPDSILRKQGPLNENEWEVMRMHPVYAYQLLSPIAYLKDSLDIPYCHHERYDGSGYPRHLAGDQIPENARLFAVVDVWDALRSDRPYRKGWEDERALEYIQVNAG